LEDEEGEGVRRDEGIEEVIGGKEDGEERGDDEDGGEGVGHTVWYVAECEGEGEGSDEEEEGGEEE
jgi:hypothetical protein